MTLWSVLPLCDHEVTPLFRRITMWFLQYDNLRDNEKRRSSVSKSKDCPTYKKQNSSETSWGKSKDRGSTQCLVLTLIFWSGFPNSDYFWTVRWSLRRINSRDDDSDNFSAPLALNQSNSTSGKDLFFVWIKFFKFQTFDCQWYSVIYNPKIQSKVLSEVEPSINREVSCRFESSTWMYVWSQFGRPWPRKIQSIVRSECTYMTYMYDTCEMQYHFGCLRFFII